MNASALLVLVGNPTTSPCTNSLVEVVNSAIAHLALRCRPEHASRREVPGDGKTYPSK